jgi:phytanoyl-CoA hydroxylase
MSIFLNLEIRYGFFLRRVSVAVSFLSCFFICGFSDELICGIGAFSDAGDLIKPESQAINKIGHALHLLSPQFVRTTMTLRNRAIARSLGFSDPCVLQSMVICKQPNIGGAVLSHQDSTFLYTDPPSAVGFWYALEDATQDNGCLSFAPGSHKRCRIRRRLVRAERGGTELVDLPLSTDNENGTDQEEEKQWQMEEVKKGSLVLIHGAVLHKSERNLSPKSRFIYTFHVRFCFYLGM